LITPISLCNHTPQCTTRLPTPTPEGTPTFAPFELHEILEANEDKEREIKYYAGQILDFYRSGSDGNIDQSIEKLEVIRELLATENGENDDFDELIDIAKNIKKILEEMNNEDDEKYTYDYDEDAPKYYWGGDDGNEIIFYDDEEDLA
jgi:hypothetical protein